MERRAWTMTFERWRLCGEPPPLLEKVPVAAEVPCVGVTGVPRSSETAPGPAYDPRHSHTAGSKEEGVSNEFVMSFITPVMQEVPAAAEVS